MQLKIVFVVDRLMDDLIAYIKGDTDQLPKNNNPLPNDVKDIYYLLADYNFKNKTWVNFNILSLRHFEIVYLYRYFFKKYENIYFLIFYRKL